MAEPKGEIDQSTIIVRDFNIHLSTIDMTTRQKISNDVEKLDNTTNQQDLTDIYRTFDQTKTESTFLSNAYTTLPK